MSSQNMSLQPNKNDQLREDLKSFLEKFSPEKLRTMPLEKGENDSIGYTSIEDNRDDFTYWVEWKLDGFGGIKGGSSFKFGIYKCKTEPSEKEGYVFDKSSGYAWVKKYEPKMPTAQSVFENIRKQIISVVTAASDPGGVQYGDIENIKLGDAFKWKIAFLYSRKNENEDFRLVPVYEKKALLTAAKRLGAIDSNDYTITIAQLQEALVNYYNNNKNKYNDICEFGGYVWKIGNADLSQSKQIIKYGAPGTGKTYSIDTEAKEFFDVWKLDTGNSNANFNDHYEFVQFHPSYSYEDFIEGIKPVLGKNSTTELKLKDGIFKVFCKKAAKYELWLLNNGLLQGQKLSEVTVGAVRAVREKIEDDNCPFNDLLKNAADTDSIEKYIPPYFFCIDEINRADLSRVFGELMYCLEYRGYEGRIKTQYAELESGDTIFYEENDTHYFFIPENVYIVGTMNTIDRSIESFDFALRRRFLWQRVEPSESVLQEYFEDNKYYSLIENWKKMNEEIAQDPLLGEDYEIGHSYLMKRDKYPDCTTPSAYRSVIWEKHIRPLLEEYFRGMGAESKKKISVLKDIFCPNPTNKKKKQDEKISNPQIETENGAKA